MNMERVRNREERRDVPFARVRNLSQPLLGHAARPGEVRLTDFVFREPGYQCFSHVSKNYFLAVRFVFHVRCFHVFPLAILLTVLSSIPTWTAIFRRESPS